MSQEWVNNGEPMADGRLCLVIDPEDGSHPQRVYGHTKDEIIGKLAKTAEHGSRFIASLRAKPAAQATSTAAPKPAARRTTMTPDEQMQATADLSNPAKAPGAIAKLIEQETGVDFAELKREKNAHRLAAIGEEWEQRHPEFPGSAINRKLLMDTASLRVGWYNITAETFDEIFAQLAADGMLVSAGDRDTTPTVQPDQPPADSTVRPRGATSYRRTTLRAAAPAQSQTRYTRTQIDAMTADELAQRVRTEPGFAELLNTFSQRARASA
jgi:hypothetical protein